MKKIFSMLLLVIFGLSLFGCNSKRELIYIQSEYPGDERMWDHIFESGEAGEDEENYEFESRPFGVILPHHLITTKEIARFYNNLTKVADPSVIVIIGPNHYENGSANIQTCDNCVYSTTKGDVELDYYLVDELIDDKVAVANSDTFLKEHAIFAHTPFIKNYFPTSKIVPIILHWKIPIHELAKLSDWLDEELPEDALVIASVDFSHYVPEEMAQFHDQTSFTTITNFDSKNIYNLEIDSPSTIYLLLDLMKKRGYAKAQRFAYTNLTDFITEHTDETTSHQFFGFFKGEIEPVEGVGILSFGNIPDDSTLSFKTDWEWDRNYDEKSDYTTTKLLRDIRGTEDRFLTGTDYYIFDLPDNECLAEEKNDIKVTFCKVLEGSFDLTELRNFIKEKKKDTDLLYMLYEFKGGGELDYDRKLLIRDMAKKGVDIFVGRGLEEVVPFEKYRGNLLFYSLGDFVTDNKLATNINAKSSGMILGLYVTEDYFYIYTFPIEITNGYPKLKDFSVRPNFFTFFTSEADFSRKDETDSQTGIIKIRR